MSTSLRLPVVLCYSRSPSWKVQSTINLRVNSTAGISISNSSTLSEVRRSACRSFFLPQEQPFHVMRTNGQLLREDNVTDVREYERLHIVLPPEHDHCDTDTYLNVVLTHAEDPYMERYLVTLPIPVTIEDAEAAAVELFHNPDICLKLCIEGQREVPFSRELISDSSLIIVYPLDAADIPSDKRIKYDQRILKFREGAFVITDEPSVYFVETCSSLEDLTERFRMYAGLGSQSYVTIRADTTEAWCTWVQIDELPLVSDLSEIDEDAALMPWSSSFVRLKIQCDDRPFMTQVWVDLSKFSSVDQLAEKIGNLLSVGEGMNVSLQGVDNLYSLQDGDTKTLEVGLRIFYCVSSGTLNCLSPAKDWKPRDLVRHLRQVLGLGVHVYVRLLYSCGNFVEDADSYMSFAPSLTQHGPEGMAWLQEDNDLKLCNILHTGCTVMVQYCSMDESSCLTNYKYSKRLTDPRLTDAWGDPIRPQFNPIGCGHTVCQWCLLRTVRTSSDQYSLIDDAHAMPDVKGRFSDDTQDIGVVEEKAINLDITTSIEMPPSVASGAFFMFTKKITSVFSLMGAESKGEQPSKKSEDEMKVRSDGDARRAEDYTVLEGWINSRHSNEEACNTFRRLMYLKSSDGYFDVPQLRKVNCPCGSCIKVVPPEVLSKLPGYGMAYSLACDDLLKWKQAQTCGLQQQMFCEPWPREAMISLGCDCYFHYDCLAGYVCSEVHKEDPEVLNCPRCKTSTPKRCDCLTCEGAFAVHRISQYEIQALFEKGHLQRNTVDRWAIVEQELAARSITDGYDEELIRCPNPRCAEVFASRRGADIACPKCECGICSQCKQESHPDMTCDELDQRRVIDHVRQSGQIMQSCPNCRAMGGIPLECYHVTCSNCGTHFCFLCGCLREPTMLHGNHYHRPTCSFFLPCCDDACIAAGGAHCKHDQRHVKCQSCTTNGGLCERPGAPRDGDRCRVYTKEECDKAQQGELRRAS